MYKRQLLDLYGNTSKRSTVASVIEPVKDFLSTYQADHRVEGTKEMVDLMKQMINALDGHASLLVSIAHKDLTPWNCYVNKNALAIYDWELAQDNTPVLFDVFHFIFQAGILVKRQSFSEIQEELDKLLSSLSLKRYIAYNKIDVALHVKLYLSLIHI